MRVTCQHARVPITVIGHSSMQHRTALLLCLVVDAKFVLAACLGGRGLSTHRNLVLWKAAPSLRSLRGGYTPGVNHSREDIENQNGSTELGEDRRATRVPTKLRLLLSALCGIVFDAMSINQLFSLVVWTREEDKMVDALNWI